MSRIVYKSLKAGGVSQYQGWTWPLPQEGEPGPWVEIQDEPVICSRGFHGWKDLETALRQCLQAPYVYEMELDGKIVEGDVPVKVAGTRARLLRLIAVKGQELIPYADYVWQ